MQTSLAHLTTGVHAKLLSTDVCVCVHAWQGDCAQCQQLISGKAVLHKTHVCCGWHNVWKTDTGGKKRQSKEKKEIVSPGCWISLSTLDREQLRSFFKNTNQSFCCGKAQLSEKGCKTWEGQFFHFTVHTKKCRKFAKTDEDDLYTTPIGCLFHKLIVSLSIFVDSPF